MLECDPGFDQQLTKQNDPSELLELQSSLSREIENEILHMNDPKDIINEIESEIAANAAVKELERIGSSENISLVGEVNEPMEVPSEGTNKNAANGNVAQNAKAALNKQKKNMTDANKTICKTKNKANKSTDHVEVKTKTVKEKNNKPKSPNGAKKSKNTEILKENGSRRFSATANDEVNCVLLKIYFLKILISIQFE